MTKLIQPNSIPSAEGLHKTPCYGHVPLKHASLFSGIGGFDLAAEWMGWENVFHCEINEFCKKILNYYWPNAKSYDDIKKTDFTIWRGEIDIITGGFPCQPYSQAGRRKGKEDDRHLWPEMLRAIREIQPTWIVGENVAGLLNWNGGMVLNEIKTDLENSGFEVFPPCILPACGKNAPHRRDRLWIVAHRNTEQRERQTGGFFTESINGSKENVADTNSDGQLRGNGEYEVNTSEGRKYAQHDTKQIINSNSQSGRLQKRDAKQLGKSKQNKDDKQFSCIREWSNFPTQPPVYSRNDGVSYGLDTSTISVAKWRSESIKAYGNSVVPQVVFEIFKALESVHRHCP